MPSTKPAARFDEAYYTRYYETKATRVHDAARIGHLARAVTEFVAWNGGELASVLDIGAGTGLWRDWFKKHKKGVAYRSTEYSSYACERYGHEQRDISKWRASDTFDLVICQGVLQYLDDARAEAAIANIGAMTRGFLYLEAITRKDLRDVCDREMTDDDIHVRSGAWYRERLGRHFDQVGCGLYYSKQGNLLFYELERA